MQAGIWERYARQAPRRRRILDNIRKVITYLLSDSFVELSLIGSSLLFGYTLPLNALQILFVNFFSDSFPALALAFEKDIDGLGSKPRVLKGNLLDKKVRFLIFVAGTITSVLLLGVYALMLYLGISEEITHTFIFASFGTYTLLVAFSMRSLEKSIFNYNPFSNFYLTLGVGFGISMMMLAVYLPFFQRIFHTVILPMPYLGAILAIGLVNVTIFEIVKALLKDYNSNKVNEV
jgi:Ca2+-transporting ATPase